MEQLGDPSRRYKLAVGGIEAVRLNDFASWIVDDGRPVIEETSWQRKCDTARRSGINNERGPLEFAIIPNGSVEFSLLNKNRNFFVM